MTSVTVTSPGLMTGLQESSNTVTSSGVIVEHHLSVFSGPKRKAKMGKETDVEFSGISTSRHQN